MIQIMSNVTGGELYNRLESHRPRRDTGLAMAGLFILYNFAVSIMYKSIVVSLLTATGEPPAVEKLGDLSKPEFENLKVLFRKDGYEYDFAKTQPEFDELSPDRIEFYDIVLQKDPQEAVQVLDKVIAGTHVLVAGLNNFKHGVCNVSTIRYILYVFYTLRYVHTAGSTVLSPAWQVLHRPRPPVPRLPTPRRHLPRRLPHEKE